MEHGLKKEYFENVVVFIISEPGAMGPAGYIGVYNSNRKYYEFDYRSKETPWENIRELFPILKQCHFAGPSDSSGGSGSTFILGGSWQPTFVPDGWIHDYLDYGNHMIIKNEFYDEVDQIFKNVDNMERVFDGFDILWNAGFPKKSGGNE